ncbi:hypothetical protein RUM43_008970 [Polyplax serrata]|uniref:Uncharacterized protein n=1 Tax=Polyplax serrata TaxID=468196 RepID=A0AAN8S1Q4_POLSC
MYSVCVSVFCLVVAGVLAEPFCPRTYPVRLSNTGPTATTIPIINKHVRTPTVERMPLRTAGCIPRPKTIDNVCTCYKTVIKPQVHNQIISVPSVQRVIQTAARPVVEKIHYEATPVDSPLCSSYPFASGVATLARFPFGLTNFMKPTCTTSLVTLPSCVCRPSALIL